MIFIKSSGESFSIAGSTLRDINGKGIFSIGKDDKIVTLEKEIKVIHPLFYVRRPDGQLKIQAVWAKSCRGAMTRYILTHRPENFEDLITFSYEGFEYNANIGNERFPHFIREL